MDPIVAWMRVPRADLSAPNQNLVPLPADVPEFHECSGRCELWPLWRRDGSCATPSLTPLRMRSHHPHGRTVRSLRLECFRSCNRAGRPLNSSTLCVDETDGDVHVRTR